VILDNLSNSKRSVLDRIRELARAPVELVVGDLSDGAALDGIFRQHAIEAVLHFAGLKAVAESVRDPLRYFHNNVGGTLSLLEAMRGHGVGKIIFSSSATVYGQAGALPVKEGHPLQAVNPYGRTKQFVERILQDVAAADPGFRFAILRYFNPVGAHSSGRLGEDAAGIPENLMPHVCRAAASRAANLRIFGDDYDTHDGTCIRDYIHVMDLAAGHVSALRYLAEHDRSITVNLGTGRGYSVLEVVRAFERATAAPVPYEIAPRRPGDVPCSFADASLAAQALGWRATRTLEEMCRDAWHWQCENPAGYPD
jgi:UDP-glucose 4-epimerase